jgi:hypothetical protein
MEFAACESGAPVLEKSQQIGRNFFCSAGRGSLFLIRLLGLRRSRLTGYRRRNHPVLRLRVRARAEHRPVSPVRRYDPVCGLDVCRFSRLPASLSERGDNHHDRKNERGNQKLPPAAAMSKCHDSASLRFHLAERADTIQWQS